MKKLGLPITNTGLVVNAYRRGKSKSTASVVPELYGSLRKSQVLSLYKLLMEDFLLFGYDIQPYLSYAN